jgi:beta-hydroxyacyl-ACP dehydratase FabZ
LPKIEHQEIKLLLHQRYPMLLVDRVIELDEKHAIGLKNITGSDAALLGHFDDDPIYPGVLLLEAMSQAGGLIFSVNDKSRRRGYLAKIDKVRFLKLVRPGDQLILHANAVHSIGTMARVRTSSFVNSECVAEAEITYIVPA